MYNSPDPQRPLPPPPPAPFHANPAPSYPPASAITQPRPTAGVDHRARTAGIALLVAAGLLLLATVTKAWFTAGDSGGVGPLGLEKCRQLVCESATWFDIKRIPTQIPIFATTALVASLVAVAFVIHGAVMLLQNRPEAVKLKVMSQLLGLTVFGMIAFVFSLSIGDWSRGLSLGWSAFVGFAGVITASLVTAFMVKPLTQRS